MEIGKSLISSLWSLYKTSVYDRVQYRGFKEQEHGKERNDLAAEILTSEQIQQLVDYIQQLPIDEPKPDVAPGAGNNGETEPEATPGAETEPVVEEISFANSVLPILDARCIDCHGTDGGWDASTYDLLMTTGDSGPVVIPGDIENSLLAQKLLGTHVNRRRLRAQSKLLGSEL